MTTLPISSNSNDLDRRASTNDATRVVRLLLGAYPQAATTTADERSDRAEYITLMISACEGVPMWALKDLVNPKFGLITKCRWLPTIAEVLEFLEGRLNAEARRRAWDAPPALESPVEVTPNERERRTQILRDVAAQIRKAAKGVRRAGPTFHQMTETEAAPRRAKALKNLEAMKG